MATLMVRNIFSKVRNPFQTKYFVRQISSNELNKEFYQLILQHHESDHSITINRIEKNPACEKGGSFMSTVSRVKVLGSKVYNRQNQEYQKSFIIKELPPNEQLELYRSKIAVENENKAYNIIVPALKMHSASPLPFPDCFYADDEVIILQDLTVDGFQEVGILNRGLTVGQIQTVLEGLAKIHAASFVFKQKEPEKFENITKLTKDILFYGGDSKLLDHQAHTIEKVTEIFRKLPPSAEYTKAIEVLQDLKRNSRLRLKQILLNPREHSVLCHGDTWAGNIMFNKKNELRFVDLQLMRYNSVASDLSYLFSVNLLPEVRIKNTKQLLNHYLNSLHANMKEKGVDLDNVLTEEWLEKEMQAFAMFGAVFGMWIMPIFFTKKEDVEISKKRLGDTSKIAKRGPEFEERVKEFILGYVRSLP